MIHENILIVISLFFAMAVLYLISEKLKISYPIFLVIGGLAISFFPGIPNINVEPDVIFLIFLPPLLFEAAWNTSWNNFWKWKRSVLLMGFGLVFFTSLAVAYFSASIIPGFTMALGFLLGGVISPPDAVAATSVLKDLKIPKRGLTILEGESLINDAASLTVFRFAIATVITGQFTFEKAATNFLLLAIMGVVVGLAIGHILYHILKNWAKFSKITTPITIIAPFLMYIVAEEFEWSGVLAVVAGGLYMSYRSKDFLNYYTRMQTKDVWETIVFLLNGFVFILIGLALPDIVKGLGKYSLKEATIYGVMIAVIVIVVRIILVYIVEYVPRLFSKSIRKKETAPGGKLPFIIGWAGMRGVVSLASALAIPLTLANGDQFPQRNLILFTTFVVILITLVFQGLTLPLFIRWLKVEEVDKYIPAEEQMENIRHELACQSLLLLDTKYHHEIDKYDPIKRVREQLTRTIDFTDQSIRDINYTNEIGAIRELYIQIMKELIDLRRATVHKMEQDKEYDDFIIRDVENNLDLEELRLSKLLS